MRNLIPGLAFDPTGRSSSSRSKFPLLSYWKHFLLVLYEQWRSDVEQREQWLQGTRAQGAPSNWLFFLTLIQYSANNWSIISAKLQMLIINFYAFSSYMKYLSGPKG